MKTRVLVIIMILKKFIKKWCSKKKKDKSNYIIDYNNIYKDSSKLLDQIEKNLKLIYYERDVKLWFFK